MSDRKYTWFIGTDVSKEKLDHAVMQGNALLFHRETENNTGAITSFLKELKQLKGFAIPKSLFCLEHTGIYSNHLTTALRRSRAHFVVEPGSRIRNSMGIVRHKNDKADAIRIAEYACRFYKKLTLWKPRRPVIDQLAQLNTIRSRLTGLQVILNVPLKEQSDFYKKADAKQSKSLCAASIAAVATDLAGVNAHIAAILEADDRLRRMVSIITSVPGVGPVTALNIIISTNEFLTISNPKKFACYAGVAPFVRESGKFKGKAKVSPLANKQMKSLLHMCAIVARRCVPEIKTYYLRKTQVEGKNKMSVFNAIRYKLILRIFACVNQDRCYQAVYDRTIS